MIEGTDGTSRRRKLFWPIAAVAVLLLGALGFGEVALIGSFDEQARQREQEVIANGLQGRINEVAHMVVPQAVWDDAVANLDQRFDTRWARTNIVEYLTQTDHFEDIYILDPSDRLIMSSQTDHRFQHYSRAALPLLQQVRADEAARHARGGPRKGEALSAPIQASAIGAVDGRLMMISATLVQPDFGTRALTGPRAPVIVAAMPIDTKFLNSFAARFMLAGLKVELGHTPLKGKAGIALRDRTGRQVGTLSWQPQHPGAALNRKIAPFAGSGIIALVLLSFWLFRRSHRMAEGLIASEARASHLAYYDSVTGYANRVLFGDRLGQALGQLRRDGRSVALLCLDLDRFKDINDTFGHHVGDELLKEAARRMAAQCRASDTFARLSGDEFAIVCTDVSADGAAHLAQRICEEVAQPFAFGSARLYIGCSIGIALLTDASLDPAEAMRLGDIALYRAKQTKKGSYCFFEPEMDAAIRSRRSLESDLREALKKGELTLAYQPQVDGRGRMTGVEALLRWDHPERGSVAPSYFIPIAEQCGFITELGMFALDQAFEDSHRWPDLRVAVNVSAAQIRDKNFVAAVAELVKEKNVSPRRFDLEITEGILLGDDPDTQARLVQLRQLGFGLALDDFGTGYSSLSYLHRYPINKIKIDRSFVANLGVESEAKEVIGAIVKMARALKLAVIAEGVETTDQLGHLTKAGCGGLQGFLYSRPISATDVDRLIDTPRQSLLELQDCH